MKPTAIALAALLSLASTAALAAPPAPYAPVPVDTVMAALGEMGITPELKTDDYGDPLINFAYPDSGYKASMYFYDCANNKCGGLQMHAGFTTDSVFSFEKMNEWNSSRRWARAYKGSGGAYHLETDTYCTAQDQKGQVKVFVGHFEQMAKQYASHLGF